MSCANRGWVLAVALLAALRGANGQRDGEQRCVFSSDPKSAMSWQPGAPDGVLYGRVIHAHDGQPVAKALVRLNPGPYYRRTDSTGWFEFGHVRAGRYELKISSTPGIPAVDSITVGNNGLVVVASLADVTLDLKECVITDSGPPPVPCDANTRLTVEITPGLTPRISWSPACTVGAVTISDNKTGNGVWRVTSELNLVRSGLTYGRWPDHGRFYEPEPLMPGHVYLITLRAFLAGNQQRTLGQKTFVP